MSIRHAALEASMHPMICSLATSDVTTPLEVVS
jgi:hypothetical protein